METVFSAVAEASAREDSEDRQGTAGRDTHEFDGAKLVPDVVGGTLLVELDDLHDGLGILLLLQARYATFLEQLLPFLGKTCELASGGIEADVGEMDRVVGCADLWAPAGGKDLGHKTKDALFGLCGHGRAAGARLRWGRVVSDGLPARGELSRRRKDVRGEHVIEVGSVGARRARRAGRGSHGLRGDGSCGWTTGSATETVLVVLGSLGSVDARVSEQSVEFSDGLSRRPVVLDRDLGSRRG